MPTGYQILDQSATYFLTLRVVRWIDIFTRKIYRDIIIDSLDFCQKNKGLEIFAWVIMSNHLHLIARSSRNDLSGTLRDFKKFTSKAIINEIHSYGESRRDWMLNLFIEEASMKNKNSRYQFWTHENHAEFLFSNKFINQKLNYLHRNPVKAGIVTNQWEYIYSSAIDYAGGRGLLPIILLGDTFSKI